MNVWETFKGGNREADGKDHKRKNFIQLGKEQGQAYAWSRTRMGGWITERFRQLADECLRDIQGKAPQSGREAKSPKLKTTITISRLKRRGYESMLDYYSALKPSIR